MPDNSHAISLEAAKAMTLRYRQNRETILDGTYQNQDILPLSETFYKDEMDVFFENTDCTSIRIYYGMDENLKVHAILVGVNDQNEDMLPTSEEEETGDIMEDGLRCPPLCPPSSPLNETV